jgi:hypothetical protein
MDYDELISKLRDWTDLDSYESRMAADAIVQLQTDLATARAERDAAVSLRKLAHSAKTHAEESDLRSLQEIDELRADLAAARARNQECILLLSRVLHELAGSASLCWEPKPMGVFDSQQAIGFVEAAIQELRSALAWKDAPNS